jgi:hypothetical protein
MSTSDLDLHTIDKHLQEYTKQKRGGWFRRNWKWVVPLDLLIILAVVAGVLYWVFYARVYNLDTCQNAMIVIEADTDVQESLGEPIKTVAWPSQATIPNARIEEDEIDVIWQVEGPKGRAKAHVLSKKRQGKWETVVLEVTLPGGKKKSLQVAGDNDAPPSPYGTGGQGPNPPSPLSNVKQPETKASDLNHDIQVPTWDKPPAKK